jgi:ATP-dependent RNA helicase HelY
MSAPESALSAAAISFFDSQPFRADAFQREAVAVIEDGRSVVVTAPTGAGKTLVAEAAVHLTLRDSKRAFYTTPIKALSNQKFSDFRAIYGASEVGLLTGDNVINGDAPLVVMTTEVLRNMIYSESDALANLGLVVLDEVHYLQDRYRGSVWEEVIIHLPAGIPLVNLSATIANAQEFTDWIESRRGPTDLVVETHRPVPLTSMYMLKDRQRESRIALLPLFDPAGKRANPQLVRLLRKGRGRYRRFIGPRRLEVADTLAAEKLLPAIYFIFSRVGCEQAAATVASAGLRLTTVDERAEIRRRAEAATEHVSPSDLGVLGYATWAAQLEQGVAAHHAGMVPAFKEAVEDLFAAGLIKLVFATETLALGINMPARAVVLERLSKFTGETHETLQPGDYTQLTGRAGRRGIDTSGTAVVLHDGRLPIERVAAIAGHGSHALRSSFQPSYNMAVNLVANYDRETAEELLGASFAQFRREHRQAELESRISERKDDLEDFRARAECDRGDIWEYIEEAGGKAGDHRTAMRDFVQQTRAGDVLQLSVDASDVWALLARGWGGGPRLLVIAKTGEVKRLAPDELSPAFSIVGFVDLPEPVRTRDQAYRRTVVDLLEAWRPDSDEPPLRFGQEAGSDPVASCPDLVEHMGWVRRIERVESEIRRLERRRRSTGTRLVTHFRSIQALLADWGYVDSWVLTAAGQQLRFVYNELDLLLSEAVRRGVFEGLLAADLAAVASMFTYQPRSNDSEGGWPTGTVAAAGDEIMEIWHRLNADERRHGLPETRSPEGGFAAIAYAWTAGVELDELFDDELAAGDFVRNCRQLLDLLRQLRDEFPGLRSVAAEAIRSVDRGIVAAGGRL